MRPDRSNYEIWFTDWIDGVLSNKQEEELMLFLKDNPDLLEEFEELPIIYVAPDSVKFAGKEGIKRTADDYSEEQFGHLCIACLENDLPADQVSELMEIVAGNDQKRKTFDLVNKLKLAPLNYTFERKSSVKKLTTGGKIIRFSAIGLSTAAAAAILILAYLSIPASHKVNPGQTALSLPKDTLFIKTSTPVMAPGRFAPYQPSRNIPEIQKSAEQPVLQSQTGRPVKHDSVMVQSEQPGYFQRAEPLYAAYVNKGEITIAPDNQMPGLQAYKPGEYLSPLSDDGRSNVEKYFARLFHEKIMKDKSSGNKPVESYELARAGIAGINKLFGWELTFTRNIDENGELVSYYYSSKLLKFNAPVKKTGRDL